MNTAQQRIITQKSSNRADAWRVGEADRALLLWLLLWLINGLCCVAAGVAQQTACANPFCALQGAGASCLSVPQQLLLSLLSLI
jgi:hypothetical protein